MYNLQHKSLYRSLHSQHLTKQEGGGVHFFEAGHYVSLRIDTSYLALEHKAPQVGYHIYLYSRLLASQTPICYYEIKRTCLP